MTEPERLVELERSRLRALVVVRVADAEAGADLAALRYRSAIDVSVAGRESGPLECWHLHCYQRVHNGQWQVRWSQATAVED